MVQFFFAEDILTAEYFAETVKNAPHEISPVNFTIIIFDVPNNILNILFKKDLIGQFRDAPLIQVDPTSSPYEYILNGFGMIKIFNYLFLKRKLITFKRWRVL